MRLTKSHLAKRVVAFVAAVGLIHVAFCAVPRWRATRPAFHREEYEKAVSMLAEEFGKGAVEKGIVSIPTDEFPLPYSGWAIVEGYRAKIIVYTAGPGGRSYLLYQGNSGEVVTAITWERARSVWALVEYATRVVSNVSPAGTQVIGMWPTPYGLTDTTWPRRRSRESQLSDDNSTFSFSRHWSAAARAGGALRSRLVDALRASDLSWTSERTTVKRAAEEVIKATIPAQDHIDRRIVDALAWRYEQLAGGADLALLKRLTRETRPLPEVCFQLPVVGKRLEAWDALRRDLGRPFLSRESVWAVEALSGKSDEEQERILDAMALRADCVGDKYWPNREARRVYAKKWPEKWKAFVADSYATLDESIRTVPVKLGAADRLTRMLAADASSPRCAEASLMLYAAAGDARSLETLEARMLRHMSTRPSEYDSDVAALVSYLKTNPRDMAVPQLLRRLLARATSATLPYARAILGEAAGEPSDALDRILLGVAMEADRALNPVLTAREKSDLRYIALGNLLTHGSAAVEDALAAYVEKPFDGDERATKWAAVMFLTRAGGERSLKALRVAQDVSLAASLIEPANTSEWQSLLGGAIAILEFRCAPSPRDYYLALTPEARKLIDSDALSRRLTVDELKALLADDRCADARETVFAALLEQRARKLTEEDREGR